MRTRERKLISSDIRLLDIENLMQYTSLGRNMALKLGEESGACIHYGKRVLYDRKKLDEYVDKLTEAS